MLLYMMILQVFTPMYISLHIHVLTCVKVAIKLGHMTTQKNIALLIAILSIILFLYKFSIKHSCIQSDNYHDHVETYIIMCCTYTCLKILMMKIITFTNLYDHTPYMY